MKGKTLAFLAFALLATTALAQDEAVKVSYQTPGGRAAVVVPEIGKLAGLQLVVNPQVADEILTINVDNVPVDKLLAQIAKVAGAVWEEKSGVWYLARPFDLAKTQEREEKAKRKVEIAAVINNYVAESRKLPPFDAKEAARMAESLNGIEVGGRINPTVTEKRPPVARAVAELLAKIDPAQLVLDEGQRVVFATPHTVMQKPLPGGSNAILREFLRQQTIFVEASKAKQPAPAQEGGETRTIMVGGLSPQAGPGDPKLGIGKALLSVTLMRGNSFRVNLVVVDPNGQQLAAGDAFISAPGATRLGPPPTAPSTPNGTPLPLSDLGREFAVLTAVASGPRQVMMIATGIALNPAGGGGRGGRGGRGGGGGGPIEATLDMSGGSSVAKPAVSAALRDMLRQPEKFDPVGIALGDVLVSKSTKDRSPLVANLPDSAIIPSMQRLLSGIGGPELEKFLDGRTDVEITREDGWTLIEPELPVQARKNRVNRVALGKLIKQLLAQSALRLDDMAAFAVAQKKPLGIEDLDGLLIGNADPSVGQDDLNQFSFGNWNTLRLYGSLGQPQKQALGAGRPLLIGDLTNEQRSYISDDYYNQGAGGMIFGGGMAFTESVSIGGQPQIPSPLQSEPTEVLPNGLLAAGAVRVNVRTEDAVRARDSLKNSTRFLSLASLSLMNSMGNGVQIEGFQKPEYDSFQPAVQTRYNFTFDLAPRVTYSRAIRDSGVLPGTSLVRWDQLPADFKAKYDQINSQLGRGGGG